MGLCSYIIIYYGVIFGILDWISDIVYFSSVKFENDSLKAACATFIVIQPIWYIFLYTVYMASHTTIESPKERLRLILLSPLYALLQYSKILGGFFKLHDFFLIRFKIKDTLQLLTLENCFKI